MAFLRALSGAELDRVVDLVKHPVPGGKAEAAIAFGADLSLVVEQLKLSPDERARRMHALAQFAEAVRGSARRPKV